MKFLHTDRMYSMYGMCALQKWKQTKKEKKKENIAKGIEGKID